MNFSFRLLTEQSIDNCIDIACMVFDEFKTNPDKLENWFHCRIRNNPWQRLLPGIGLGVYTGNHLIGFRIMLAQPWWFKHKARLITFGANTSIDQNFRGHGLATQLIDKTRDFSSLTGSTTAGDVLQKVFKKMNSYSIGGDDNDFFRLRSSYQGAFEHRLNSSCGKWIGRLFDIQLKTRDAQLKTENNFKLKEIFHCDESFDRLWKNSRNNYISCLEHSSSYLNWRLFQYPTCPLRLFSLYRNNQLSAYAIWHQKQYSSSFSLAVLRDVFYKLEDETSIKHLLYYLLEYWRQEGISWVSLEVASPQLTRLFYNLGYEHVNSHGNRYQIFSDIPLDQNTIQTWYRSGMDGDYFDY